jgi:hypothetical protein
MALGWISCGRRAGAFGLAARIDGDSRGKQKRAERIKAHGSISRSECQRLFAQKDCRNSPAEVWRRATEKVV